MPLIEINGEIRYVTKSQKMLKSSCWRKVAGVMGFIQLSSYLMITLVLVSGAFIQVFTGVAPYHYEILRSINKGVMMRNLHRDIVDAHNYGVSALARDIFEETVNEVMDEGRREGSMSTDLKRELDEADWGMLLTIFVFVSMVTTNQCWRGAQLLRASLKWQNPTRALDLMQSWSSSISSFRNYLIGFTVSVLLFGSEVSGLIVLMLVGLWIATCLISLLAHGYFRELTKAALQNDGEEII